MDEIYFVNSFAGLLTNVIIYGIDIPIEQIINLVHNIIKEAPSTQQEH